jgi:hypothetical protein
MIDDLPLRDVVFDNRSKRWACCGSINGTRLCDSPTKEYFDAPRPQELLGNDGDRDRDGSGRGHPPPPPPPPFGFNNQNQINQTTQSHNETSSAIKDKKFSGAEAGGIGAGIALFLALLIGVAFLFCARRRKRKTDQIEDAQAKSISSPFSPPMSTIDRQTWGNGMTPTQTMAAPPPAYPENTRDTSYTPTTMTTPMTYSDPFTSRPTTAIHPTVEVASGGKTGMGEGHPLEEQAQAGLPLRHELPSSDNEIRPAVSPSIYSVHPETPGSPFMEPLAPRPVHPQPVQVTMASMLRDDHH